MHHPLLLVTPEVHSVVIVRNDLVILDPLPAEFFEDGCKSADGSVPFSLSILTDCIENVPFVMRGRWCSNQVAEVGFDAFALHDPVSS